MTERERWVVYPLLFLALGAALRDKLVDRTTTKSIVCQELRVEDEPVGNQPARVLARIGRTEATSSAPAIGYFGVQGEVEVTGIVKVDGVVNARQYAYQGIPVTPLFQAMPGNPLPDLLRALQAAQAQQQSRAPDGKPQAKQPPAKPSATTPDSSPNGAPPKSQSGENAPPKK